MTDISKWFKVIYTGNLFGPGIFPKTWQGVVFFIIFSAVLFMLGIPGILPLSVGLKVILIIVMGIIFFVIHIKVVRNPSAYDE